MILVNRNFGNPVLASAIGDMFRGSSDVDQKVDWVPNTGALASNSSLVATFKPDSNIVSGGEAPVVAQTTYLDPFNYYNTSNCNFYLVTEHFLKTLDKVYTKIWNESFTETGIYVPANLATMYHGFVIGGELTANNTDFMIFKKFVDRCIISGILLEEDRLQYEDQIFLSGMSRADLSTQIDLNNKLITFAASKPIDIKPDLNATTQQYLEGKKLYLMMTPYLTNESVIKNRISNTVGSFQEPISLYQRISWLNNYNGQTGVLLDSPVRQPIAFFKPKTDASKFGRSLPLATHLIWSIGTPEDKELALLEGKPVPDLIFDHLDRISHIDSLTLKIKFDKLSF